MEKSIFEKIADRKLPGHIVWEDETHIAFLTIGPIAEGHTLVVPKKNLGDDLFDLSDAEYQELLAKAKTVAKLLKEKMEAERVIMWVEGFEVPHVHVHLVPLIGPIGLLGDHIKEYSDKKMQEIHQRITE